MTRIAVIAVIVMLSTGLSGCAPLPSKAADGSFVVPEQWHALRARSPTAEPLDASDGMAPPLSRDDTDDPDVNWWGAYRDLELTTLIVRAQARNLDIEAARLRLEQADIVRRRAVLAGWPQLSATVRRDWEGADVYRRETQARLAADYEWDLWGRRAADEQAASMRSEGERLQQAAVAQRIAQEVAGWYWRRGALNAERLLADEEVVDAEHRLVLARQRYALGAVDADAVARVSAQLAALRISVREALQRRDAANDALSVLLATPSDDVESEAAGEYAVRSADGTADGSAFGPVSWPATPSPFALCATAAPCAPLRPLPSVAADIPADVLARRPDVQASDRRLRAALADVDAARASFYPRISLTGAMSTVSNDLLRLVSHPLSTLTSELTLPFLAWRDRQSRLSESDVARRLALNSFGSTLYRALAEVEGALSKEARFAQEDQQRERILAEARQRECIAYAQYRAGQKDVEPWLESRSVRRSAEADRIRSRLARLLNRAELARALGA